MIDVHPMLLLSMWLPAVIGGICLMQPEQRGGTVGAYEEASAVCENLDAPCGYQSSTGVVQAFWPAGEEAPYRLEWGSVGYNSDAPGNISLFLWRSVLGPSSRIQLWSQPDEDSDELQENSGAVMIPADLTPDLYVLQAIYASNFGITFYACADVVVIPAQRPRGHTSSPGNSSVVALQDPASQNGVALNPMVWIAGLVVLSVITLGARSMTSRVAKTKYQKIRDLSINEVTRLEPIPEHAPMESTMADTNIDGYHSALFF